MTISAKKRNTWPMRNFFFIFLFFSAYVSADSARNEIQNILKDKTLTKNQIQKIRIGKTITAAELVSITKLRQSLDFKVYAIHPLSCRRGFRKISQYEEYSNYINFIKESTYDEKTNVVYLKMKPPIIRKFFYLEFKIPRIQEAGDYAFTFTKGFLLGLKGRILVSQLKNKKCLLSISANWQGKKLKYPKKIFEFFTESILENGIKKLIRMSTI